MAQSNTLVYAVDTWNGQVFKHVVCICLVRVRVLSHSSALCTTGLFFQKGKEGDFLAQL